MTRLLITADWHLEDRPGRYGSFDWLGAQEQVLDEIADLAESQEVDVILHCGDMFEHRRPDPRELRVCQRFLHRVRPTPVMMIPGNGRHDGNFDGAIALDLFEDTHVTVHRRPDLARLDGVTVAALPWVHEGWLAAKAGGDIPKDELHAIAAEHLVSIAAGFREIIDGPAVLMLHWALSGSALPTGLPVEQLREVVLPSSDLYEQGWDFIAAGHVHKAQLVTPTCFYTGAPYPLSFGEERNRPVVYLATIDGDYSRLDEWPLEHGPRFQTVDLDPDAQFGSFDGDVDGAIVRVLYEVPEDEAAMWDNDIIRQACLAAGAVSVTVQPTIIRDQRARVAGVDETLDEQEALSAWCASEQIDKDTAAALRERLTADLSEVAR
jgi:DNA repair exonuclease SbcCD nuclease subunit